MAYNLLISSFSWLLDSSHSVTITAILTKTQHFLAFNIGVEIPKGIITLANFNKACEWWEVMRIACSQSLRWFLLSLISLPTSALHPFGFTQLPHGLPSSFSSIR